MSFPLPPPPSFFFSIDCGTDTRTYRPFQQPAIRIPFIFFFVHRRHEGAIFSLHFPKGGSLISAPPFLSPPPLLPVIPTQSRRKVLFYIEHPRSPQVPFHFPPHVLENPDERGTKASRPLRCPPFFFLVCWTATTPFSPFLLPLRPRAVTAFPLGGRHSSFPYKNCPAIRPWGPSPRPPPPPLSLAKEI